MPRKVRDPLEPAASLHDSGRQEPLEPPPAAGVKRGPGRPSNASKLAAQAPPSAAPAPPVIEPILPADMLPVTSILLRLLARGIKGDQPTSEEIALVNDPACRVANKYNILGKWAPELALLGSLMIVAQMMRQRQLDKMGEGQPEDITKRPQPLEVVQ